MVFFSFYLYILCGYVLIASLFVIMVGGRTFDSIICLVDWDFAAGLVVSVVNPQPGETIIDCCAAPGGKTLFMASYLRGQGGF